MCEECQEVESSYSESVISEGWDKTVAYKSEEILGKVCTKCGEWKVFGEYYLKGRNRKGYRSVCKSCLYSLEKEKKPVKESLNKKSLGESNTTKVCSKCKAEKPLSAFGFHKNRKGGYNTVCKDCINTYAKWQKSSEFVTSRLQKVSIPGMKQCTSCEEIKPLSYYSANSRNKDGLSIYCKECTSKYLHNWSVNKKEKVKDLVPSGTKFCIVCGLEQNVCNFSVSISNKDCLSSVCKSCKNKSSSERTKDFNFTPDLNGTKVCSVCKIEKSSSDFYKDRRVKDGLCFCCKSCTYERISSRIKNNIQVRIRHRLRGRLAYFIKKGVNISPEAALSFLGCTMEEFMERLEHEFYSDPKSGREMTWDNYGKKGGEYGWDFEHSIPLSRVDLEDSEQLEKVCHFSNIHPMWGWQNRKKFNRLPSELNKAGEQGVKSYE